MRQSPKNIRFSELEGLVKRLGYILRKGKGAHHIYTAPGLPMINLQSDGHMAKSYQVKQVLDIIDDHGLEVT